MFSGILSYVGGGNVLVVKSFQTLYRSVVLNIVKRSTEFIQTRGGKMGGRVHVADMSPKLIMYW